MNNKVLEEARAATLQLNDIGRKVGAATDEIESALVRRCGNRPTVLSWNGTRLIAWNGEKIVMADLPKHALKELRSCSLAQRADILALVEDWGLV